MTPRRNHEPTDVAFLPTVVMTTHRASDLSGLLPPRRTP